jgi:hydroxymethylglutaryl-CoA lyase
MKLPKSIKIIEVGPRDGLQNESSILTTENKSRLIRSLIDSGISNIEVTSFVHPKLVPQLADAELLLEKIPWNENKSYSALVPNFKGFTRSQNTDLKEITIIISASESHNKSNINCTIAESFKSLEKVCVIAKDKKIRIRGEVAVSFGCPFEGEIAADQVISIAKRLYEIGASEVVLADTIGVANPRQVYNIFSSIKSILPGLSLAAHFHDTNKTALANIIAAICADVKIFDSSIAGLGGCPFAPGATGNVATENLVYMMDKMNIDTKVDIKKLLRSVQLVEKLFNKDIKLIPELKKIKES